MTTYSFIQSGKKAIEIEIKAAQSLLERLRQEFHTACELILQTKGRVIVTGMGKSGHIGKKIAASLASTGTPAFFVHPGEAVHGDLGMIKSEDTIIAISNSGNNLEIVQILPLLKRLGTEIIAITGNLESPLAQHSTVALDASVTQEACPLDLAPTASTTVTLMLGDALVVALLDARGFTAEDFALSHPGGKLGRTLLTRVDDIMVSGDALPIVQSGVSLEAALLEMTQQSLGMTGIVNNQNQLIGIYTDGDLRRSLVNHVNIQNEVIDQHMTPNPRYIAEGTLAATAVKFMQDHNINGLFVLDREKRPVGAFNMLNVLHAGLN